MTVITLETGNSSISRRAVINAPAAELFALLSDPHHHHDIDGSGTVQERVEGPHELAEGAKFSVAMKQYGVPYKITSKVTAYEQDKVIEWSHPAGHRWRWEFEAVGPTQTQVTETWDPSRSPVRLMFKVMGVPGQNAKGITKTLEGLQQRYAS